MRQPPSPRMVSYSQSTTSPTHSSTPCPFHLSRGETYYHPATSCHLYRQALNAIPPSRQIAPPTASNQRQSTAEQPTPRVEIINFQEQTHRDLHDAFHDPAPYYDRNSQGDDFSAHGTDNLHQDLDPDGDYQYDSDQTSGYFVQTPARFSC